MLIFIYKWLKKCRFLTWRLHTAFVKLRQADHATSMTHPRRLAQKLKRNACKDRHDQKQCHTERQDEKETICNFICCSRREDLSAGSFDAMHHTPCVPRFS
jgi:hypothetical protein